MNDVKKLNHDSVVTLHYTLRLEDGSIADSSKNYDAPAKLKVNDGTLQAGFVEKLIGLQEGSKERFLIRAVDAFGERDERGVHQLARSDFGDFELEEGVIMEFDQPNGEVINGIVRKLDDNFVTVDFNHPLAGQDIIFEVEILVIE